MTPIVKKILYATDLSPNSAYALRFALNTAKLYQAEIIILHSFDHLYPGFAPLLDTYIDGKEQLEIYSRRVADAKAEIEKRLRAVYDAEIEENPDYVNIAKSIEVCEGFPAETILNMAEQEGCDMIIMGTHGKGIIGNTFLGSTSKRVLRRTRKPVYIIPLPKDETDVTVREAA